MGQLVVAAIRDNRPHICTHAEFLDEVIARNRALEAAFPAGQQVPEARTAFENFRRAMVDGLMTQPVKD
jgi:hypothetical protein